MGRHIPLDGATNFRDFGGYATPRGTVVQGRLYRSDRLSELSRTDYQRLEALQIELVIDLRRPSELETHPTRWPGASRPELWNTPLIDDAPSPSNLKAIVQDPEARHSPEPAVRHMVAIYRGLINDPLPRYQFKQIIERLAGDGGPAIVVHCSGGKDRTGVVVALVQSLLGISESDVIKDFMLSQRYYDGRALMHERASQVLDTADVKASGQALLPVFTVQRNYIEAAFEEIRIHHGNVEQYLLNAVGVSAEVLASLRAHLLNA